MKNRIFLLPILCFALFGSLATRLEAQDLITFEDLSENGSGTYLQNGYHDLNWNNCAVLNAILFTNLFGRGVNGVYYGMASASNVVINGNGSPDEIDSAGTNFNFLSVYLTGAYNSNLNIEVQGFSGATLLYDTTVVAGATNPTLFTFNYLDIDRLTFSSSGGLPAFGLPGSPNYFVMDNLTVDLVPEPSSLLLAVGAVLALSAFLKRRRV